ncbi:aromatic ring-hydroxylating oxygenase subunit alpha [Novosphingopyxis sp.]|uniref:aromatic ring-hydroxylating oxygenase subunit alpha n=1 Tax=Novosphingopyxis sp. TaxID=2709690 RepID=UPI003B599DB3
MREAREVELSTEFFRMYDAGSTSMADAVRPQSTHVYSNAGFLKHERKILFRGHPLYVCMAGDVAVLGSYVTAELDGLPVVVIRGKDGELRALVNMCIHRGSRVFTQERGTVRGRGVSCPFHAWTFDTRGALLGRPHSKGGFDSCADEGAGMRQLPLFERHGAIFVSPLEADDPVPAPVDPAAIFGDADADIADLSLANCRFHGSATRKLALNWKLVIDTFLEAYHVFALHRDSLATRQLHSPSVFEDMGPVGLVIGVRKSVLDEQAKAPQDRRFSPYATLQYIVYPNVIISHQIDHIETWMVFPGEHPGEAIATTSIYSYGDVIDDRTKRYLSRSIEVLMDVTDKEDFPQVMQTQKALMAGGAKEFVFGRNEPGLIHYHEWLDRAMERGVSA